MGFYSDEDIINLSIVRLDEDLLGIEPYTPKFNEVKVAKQVCTHETIYWKVVEYKGSYRKFRTSRPEVE
jgi:hypothetical protein